MTTPGPTLKRMYEIAATAKASHEALKSRLFSGQITILYHPPRGQELISAASGVALQPDDYMVNIYRGLADHIAKGIDLRSLFSEMLGKKTGSCGGRGGAMHVTDPEVGIMATTGVVGGGLPIATGLGLSSVLKKDGRVTVCNFGDGASNIGAFHESLNLAALWKLPVVFLCQNNQYGEHMELAKHLGDVRIGDRAASYGMVGETVDGNNADEIYAAVQGAVDRARAGEGPTLIDAMTFRLAGHFAFDDCSYMPPGRLQAAIDADPVPRLRADLISRQIATAAELDQLDTEIAAKVEEALEFAQAADYPEPSELLDHVYAEAVPV